ncbi:uncharacterized protein EV154DRAFT_489148 [Mucor mucedo]|uniref:uncharacterized protein n=1 Tax=Mucor mucedo TaxID=29922 RepID=UPI002220025F|nr:uncharacterized protein EV154DRAFT_489148 [Mucor mucedo]KAI7862830.1 hypothetical protein EV154DRAFT_489148 [Mucor mucedo]
MNNTATNFRISKLEESISDLHDKLDRQNDLLKDLAQLLAPSFADPSNSNLSSHILEASQQAKTTGIANSLNPDLLGKRNIPKVLEEATKKQEETRQNCFPTPRLRLLALLNYFNKKQGNKNLQLEDKLNLQHYAILKSLARKTHDDMADKIMKHLRSKDLPQVLPVWSKVSSSLLSKYAFMLENNANSHGYPLHQCINSWAATLLLFETHKHRSNRARIRAVVYNNPSPSINQRIAEQTREENAIEKDDVNNMYNQYIQEYISDSGGEPDYSYYDLPTTQNNSTASAHPTIATTSAINSADASGRPTTATTSARPTIATTSAINSADASGRSSPVSLAPQKRRKPNRIIRKYEDSDDEDAIIKPKHGRKQYYVKRKFIRHSNALVTFCFHVIYTSAFSGFFFVFFGSYCYVRFIQRLNGTRLKPLRFPLVPHQFSVKNSSNTHWLFLSEPKLKHLPTSFMKNM